MIVRAAIVLLCCLGVYLSAFMLGKTRRAARGEIAEPSVVQTPRARALGGVSNAALGLAYYLLLAAATFAFGVPGVWIGALCAALFAAALSLYLAYSLLFVTRMPCRYCWTSHAINLLLPLLVFGARPGP
ncbi:MAG: vitamin K epoxide reductase family protein [Candidatus Velthaea sp.]|jgi:uncharacterized membrane protein